MKKTLVAILLLLSCTLNAQLHEINSAGDPETYFETSFQVLQDDSTVSIFHKNILVRTEYCSVHLKINGIMIFEYQFPDDGEWKIVEFGNTDEAYYHKNGEFLFIIEVVRKWIYIKVPHRTMYLYYETPSQFEISIK